MALAKRNQNVGRDCWKRAIMSFTSST